MLAVGWPLSRKQVGPSRVWGSCPPLSANQARITLVRTINLEALSEKDRALLDVWLNGKASRCYRDVGTQKPY